MRAETFPSVKSSSTIRAAMRAARTTLDSSDSPDLDSQVLLAHSLDVDRAFLFAHPERTLSERECGAFLDAVNRRAAGEPIAYITGAKGFYDIDMQVSPAVLIPRPETEHLLKEALRLSEDRPDLIVADIGTGSGALAAAFARHRPKSNVYATEICADALAVARGNAERNGVNPTFLEGDLAEPLIQRAIKIDLLMANLPYIASDELAALAVSRFEPRLALDGGIDGLALIRRLLMQIPSVCRADATVLLEIGADQAESVARLVGERLGSRCDILLDYAGLDRIVRFQV
ncbi:MAG: peptide chain release factor N(5)-glutamine methyltransferase [Chloroflexota bacterium]|nr:peptide chain release factor N(5)-glutamine methyltransferase [Chloroflexota bacterium]